MVPAVGGLLALTAALTGACFVRAFGTSFLGRSRSPAADRASEVDRYAVSAMFVLSGLCLLAGILPGLVIDGLAPIAAIVVGDRMPAQANVAWLSIIPVGESRSSYNGLLVFLFIAVSAFLAAFIIHRLASRALRRAPAWGCGFTDMTPAAQYTADSFAQPIRRVFGTLWFRARERVTMPPPGDLAPARFSFDRRDPVWDSLYAPLAAAIGLGADRLNHLQFLTIRRYLSLVFVSLVTLLLVLALWS
jgi:hydrogenase-4 component B